MSFVYNTTKLGPSSATSVVSVASSRTTTKRSFSLQVKPVERKPVVRQRSTKCEVKIDQKLVSGDNISMIIKRSVNTDNKGLEQDVTTTTKRPISTSRVVEKEYKPLSMVAIEKKRSELLAHPVYNVLNDPENVRIFMKHHVFAVWDFMSLLKRLQQQLTCVTVPWMPPASIKFARFINEIVLGEETDENLNGGYTSHFDLYLQAMNEVNADTKPILSFLSKLKEGRSIEEALLSDDIPLSVRKFVSATLHTAVTGQSHEVAASFFFGREEVIPDMFKMMVKYIENQGGKADRLIYYLDRHIAVDGGEHGPLAEKLLASLCEDNERKRKEAEQVAIKALSVRVELWTGVLQEINELTKQKIVQ